MIPGRGTNIPHATQRGKKKRRLKVPEWTKALFKMALSSS